MLRQARAEGRDGPPPKDKILRAEARRRCWGRLREGPSWGRWQRSRIGGFPSRREGASRLRRATRSMSEGRGEWEPSRWHVRWQDGVESTVASITRIQYIRDLHGCIKSRLKPRRARRRGNPHVPRLWHWDADVAWDVGGQRAACTLPHRLLAASIGSIAREPCGSWACTYAIRSPDPRSFPLGVGTGILGAEVGEA